MQGFRESDHANIVDCFTDDVIWEIHGHTRLQGKQAFDREIENEAFEGKPVIELIRLVEEGNIVVAEGTVLAKPKGAEALTLLFCDVFHFRNGKISQLSSYLVPKQKG